MKKIVKIIANKYLLTGAIFVVWTVYFDQNDWVTMKQRQQELDNVKSNIAYLDKEIARMSDERAGLLTDPAKLEQYAREHFRMKHEGEDVYVLDNAPDAK